MPIYMKPNWEWEEFGLGSDRPGTIAKAGRIMRFLYARPSDFYLIGIDVTTKTELWRIPLGNDPPQPWTAADERRYFFASASHLNCVDYQTGRQIWSRAFNYSIRNLFLQDNFVVGLAFKSDYTRPLVFHEKMLFSLDKDGRNADFNRTEIGRASGMFAVVAPLAIWRKNLIYARDNTMLEMRASLDAATKLFSLDMDCPITQITVIGDACVIGLKDEATQLGLLKCLDLPSKQFRWQQSYPQWAFFDCIGTEAGYILRCRHEGKECLRRIEPKDGSASPPIWDQDLIQMHQASFVRNQAVVIGASATFSKKDPLLTITTALVSLFDGKITPLSQRGKWPNQVVSDGDRIFADVGTSIFMLDANFFWRSRIPGLFHCAPAVISRAIVAGEASGEVFAVNLDDGRQGWTTRLEGVIACSPASAVLDCVYVAHSKFISALDVSTGRALWRHDASYEITALSALENELIIFANANNRISAITSNHAELWNFDAPGVVRTGFTYDGSAIYFADDTGILHSLTRGGKENWKYPLPSPIRGRPVCTADTVCYAEESGRVVVINPVTRAILWSFPVQAWILEVWAAFRIVVCDDDGIVHLLNVKEQREIWHSKKLGVIGSAPAVVGGTAFVGTRWGVIFGLDLTTGDTIREIDLGTNAQPFLLSHPEAAIGMGETGTVAALVP